MSKMYMVRAGKNAKLINHYKEDNLVAIGWAELGNLNKAQSKRQIKNLVNDKYPQLNEKEKEPIINCVCDFLNIKIGDYVVSYNKPEKEYIIGNIISEYEYMPDKLIEGECYPNVKKVHWIKDISRGLVNEKTREILNDTRQVFSLDCEPYNDILDLIDENISSPLKTEPKYKSGPFFAYGNLKHDQLKYHYIKDLVVDRKEYEIQGNLIIRDGLPFYRKQGNNKIKGELLYFGENSSKAYEIINSITNERYYRWNFGIERKENNNPTENKTNKRIRYNLLEDNNPCSNSRFDDSKNEYDSKLDPLFTDGISMIKDFINIKNPEESQEKRLIRLQMNYLLLWIIIERFEELKYPPSTKKKKHDEYLKDDEKFIKALNDNPPGFGAVYNTRSFYENKIDEDNIYSTIRYFRTLRNNITHRGKTRSDDYYFLKKDLETLLKIFEELFELSY